MELGCSLSKKAVRLSICSLLTGLRAILFPFVGSAPIGLWEGGSNRCDGWRIRCQGLAALAVEHVQQGAVDAETQRVAGCNLVVVVEAQHDFEAVDPGVDELLGALWRHQLYSGCEVAARHDAQV